MQHLCAGDLVTRREGGPEMVIVACADEHQSPGVDGCSFFCVWDDAHQLHEEVFGRAELRLLRQERRRVPRPNTAPFPPFPCVAP